MSLKIGLWPIVHPEKEVDRLQEDIFAVSSQVQLAQTFFCVNQGLNYHMQLYSRHPVCENAG